MKKTTSRPHADRGITELTLTELLALSHAEVVARVQSGEWGIAQFTQWAEDRLSYAFGDGYEEGYSTAEEQATLPKTQRFIDANCFVSYN